jgi:hypothetical protein
MEIAVRLSAEAESVDEFNRVLEQELYDHAVAGF